jgi:hypothetical protein
MTLNQKQKHSYLGGKVILYGQSVDCYFFNKIVIKKTKDLSECEPEKREIDPLTSFYRSKSKAKKIIKCNGWKWFNNYKKPFMPVLLTLTFAENFQNLTEANRKFSKFIQKLNYYIFNDKKAKLQYLGVVEFQKRGAIHYHIIFFNLPFIKNIYKIWTEGRVDLKSVKTMNELIRYLSKYMVKESADGRLRGRKRYFTSKKIFRPIIIKSYFITKEVSDVLKNRLKYQKSFEVDFIGRIDFYNYLLKNNENILDFNLDPFSRLEIESEINIQKEKTTL